MLYILMASCESNNNNNNNNNDDDNNNNNDDDIVVILNHFAYMFQFRLCVCDFKNITYQLF